MTLKYQSMAFTDDVRSAQANNGSAAAYSHGNTGTLPADQLGENEQVFIDTSDSFYMASIGSNGWPYVQHRGGPAGFLKVLSPSVLAMPDFRGNRQYITLGNAAQNDRVSLFFMDYGRQARLKIYARIRAIELADNPELIAKITTPDYKAKVERIFEFTVEAFDWNCPQHITPRYTEADIRTVTDRLTHRVAELEAEILELKGGNKPT